MNTIVASGLKYFLLFCLLYSALTAISLIPQVGASSNYLYRQPTQAFLKTIFPKAYLSLKTEAGNADLIRVEYASKARIQQLMRERAANPSLRQQALQIPGKTYDIRFYNMFLSFYLFFLVLMVLSPLPWKERLTGMAIGTILFYLYTLFRTSLILILLFNEPDVAIYQTNKTLILIFQKLQYGLTMGVKMVFIIILWAVLTFRKSNWKELFKSKVKG